MGEIAVNSSFDGVVSYGLGKVPIGILSGRNNISATYRGGLTALRNGTKSTMGIGVMKKGVEASFIGGMPMDIYYGVKPYFLGSKR